VRPTLGSKAKPSLEGHLRTIDEVGTKQAEWPARSPDNTRSVSRSVGSSRTHRAIHLLDLQTLTTALNGDAAGESPDGMAEYEQVVRLYLKAHGLERGTDIWLAGRGPRQTPKAPLLLRELLAGP